MAVWAHGAWPVPGGRWDRFTPLLFSVVLWPASFPAHSMGAQPSPETMGLLGLVFLCPGSQLRALSGCSDWYRSLKLPCVPRYQGWRRKSFSPAAGLAASWSRSNHFGCTGRGRFAGERNTWDPFLEGSVARLCLQGQAP